MESSYVYILASDRNGTLYVGVTSDIIRRVYQHRNDMAAGFSSKYEVHMLVYYEIFGDIREAILREKQLKWWKRQWKIELIERDNPEWIDLYEGLLG